MERKENIQFLLERLYISTEIPFHVYDSTGVMVMKTGHENDQSDPFHTDKKLWKEIQEKSKEKYIPVLYFEAGTFIYGSFFDKEGRYYICGPTVIASPSVSEMHYFRERHGVDKEEKLIPVKTYMVLANLLCMAFWGITDNQVTEEELLTAIDEKLNDNQVKPNDFYRYQFEKSEHDISHLSYQYEQQYLTAVENGDVEFFKESYATDPKAMEKIGKLADNSSKQMEYMCLSSIVLVSRSSMRGGLNPSIAYALSELYMQKLERCNNTQDIIKLHQMMRIDFVTRVKNEKDTKIKKDYIEKCKNYITQYVHYPIRISEIADKIGVNNSYLSRKFSEQEGITIAQYNIKVRLHAAANMLKYSEFSIAEVSDYFCFASQSRFGNQFKKEFGVTPFVYRKENQVIDFFQKPLLKEQRSQK